MVIIEQAVDASCQSFLGGIVGLQLSEGKWIECGERQPERVLSCDWREELRTRKAYRSDKVRSQHQTTIYSDTPARSRYFHRL